MSIAREARLIKATAPVPFAALAERTERMIAIQMTAYPASWTEEEKREMAEQHLFGARS